MIPLKILFLFVLINVFGGVRTFTPVDYTDPDQVNTWRNAKNVYEFTVKDINGNNVSMSKYKGKVMIILNVASNCGITNRTYHKLNELYDKYSSKGLVILGFPCNQFMNREPGTNEEISKFVAEKHVKFPMFEKIDVNGENAPPLWKYMKSKAKFFDMEKISFNFTKFIVDREGKVVKRISPINPMSIEWFVSEYFDPIK